MQDQEAFLAAVADAKTRIKEITVAELKQIKAEETPCFLIDVRENDEWARGFIADAIHLPRAVLAHEIEKIVSDKAACVVLYCGGGYRSALAADTLQKMGYQRVFSLAGGYGAWQLG